MPVRCHRADFAVRSDRPEPGRNDVRQGKAAERVRRDGQDGPGPDPDPFRAAQHRVRTRGTGAMSDFVQHDWAALLIPALTLAGVYLLLPRARGSKPLLGASLG